MANKPTPPPEVALAVTESAQIVNPTQLETLELHATMLVVESDADLENANQLIHPVAAMLREWTEYWAPKKAAAHTVHKMLCDAEKQLADRLMKIRRTVESKMSVYVTEQRRKAAEEQERVRREVEAEQERLRKEAEKLMAKGFVAEAQQKATVSENIVVPTVPVEPVQLAGTRTRETWGCTINDKMALVKAVAQGVVPLEALDVNEAYIRGRAREMGGLDWPGVVVKKEVGFAVGRY